jgi:hypothetical protein
MTLRFSARSVHSIIGATAKLRSKMLFFLSFREASGLTVLGTTDHKSDSAEAFSFLFKHLRSLILVTVI